MSAEQIMDTHKPKPVHGLREFHRARHVARTHVQARFVDLPGD